MSVCCENLQILTSEFWSINRPSIKASHIMLHILTQKMKEKAEEKVPKDHFLSNSPSTIDL